MAGIFNKKSRAEVPKLLCVQIESGHKVWYRLNGVDEPIEHIAEDDFIPDAPYLSLINDDFRRKAIESLSNKAATSLVSRSIETMDSVVVINHSKKGWVYGTTKTRLDDESVTAAPIPLMMAVDALIANKGIVGPAIVGVVFEKDGLSLLFALDDGKLKNEESKSRYQISISNENIEGSAVAFASMMNLPEDVSLYLFEKEELLLAPKSFTAYPMDGGLDALFVGKVLPGMAALSVVTAAGLWGWVTLQQNQIDSIQAQISIEQLAEEAANKQIAAIIEGNPVGVVKSISLDISKAFLEAETLWISDSKFESELSTTNRVHTVTLNYRNNRTKTLDDINSQDKFELALTRTAPEGCRLTGITFAGNMNEIKSKYACTSSPGPLARFGF